MNATLDPQDEMHSLATITHDELEHHTRGHCYISVDDIGDDDCRKENVDITLDNQTVHSIRVDCGNTFDAIILARDWCRARGYTFQD